MRPRIRRLLTVFLVLLALLALEVWMSFWLPPSYRLLILVPAVIMAVVIAFEFMEVGEAISTAHLFVVASLLWLGILFGLGTLDPLTRTRHPVQVVGSQ